MSGPIKHNTTGLWVKKKHPAQRAEKKSELIMNIHAAGGLNDCCFTGLWAVAKQFVRKEMAEKVSLLSTFSHPPPEISKHRSQINNGQGSVCPQVTRKIPTSTLFFPLLFIFFPLSANLRRKVFFFCVKWCSAEWQTNRAIAAPAKAHFSILGVSFS